MVDAELGVVLEREERLDLELEEDYDELELELDELLELVSELAQVSAKAFQPASAKASQSASVKQFHPSDMGYLQVSRSCPTSVPWIWAITLSSVNTIDCEAIRIRNIYRVSTCSDGNPTSS